MRVSWERGGSGAACLGTLPQALAVGGAGYCRLGNAGLERVSTRAQPPPQPSGHSAHRMTRASSSAQHRLNQTSKQPTDEQRAPAHLAKRGQDDARLQQRKVLAQAVAGALDEGQEL